MNQETDSLPGIETMHREHKEWLSEYATWMNEVASWQREQQLAEAMLYQLERALPDHIRIMKEHSTSIASHEKRLCEHEKRLSDYEISGQRGNGRIADLVEARIGNVRSIIPAYTSSIMLSVLFTIPPWRSSTELRSSYTN